MPTSGKEVYLTKVEIAVMQVFIKEKIFSDLQIANILTELANKLKGDYDEAA
jgi:hypothetical protein